MLPLTVHLLTNNNEGTLAAALESLAPLDATVAVMDTGSADRTLDIADEMGAAVYAAPAANDRGRSRNSFVAGADDDWHLYLEPWEVLASGHREIVQKVALANPAAFHIQVVSGDALTKQVRLWHRATALQFTRPVFEALSQEGAGHLSALICGTAPPNADPLPALMEWKRRTPTATDPLYYHACHLLERKDWDGFLAAAAGYLFRETKTIVPVTMTRYYCAMVQGYVKKNAGEAIKYLMACLAANPLMAEFWCLLGDVYYFLVRKYSKAQVFYQNAIDLGSRRLKTDPWPLQLSKYGEYPRKMIASCETFTAGGTWLA